MKLLPKILLLIALGALGAGAWQQAAQFEHRQEEITRLERFIADQRLQVQRLHAERDDFLARAVELPANPAPTLATGDAEFDSHMKSTFMRVSQLEKWLARNPEQKIPEFQFLMDSDWLDAVASQSSFDVKAAASSLRSSATSNFGPLLAGAITNYETANQGLLPKDPTELTPFFVSAVDEAILKRYEMRASGTVADLPSDFPLAGVKPDALMDGSTAILFSDGIIHPDYLPFQYNETPNSALELAISKAHAAFRLAHHGNEPSAPSELLSFFDRPEDVKKFSSIQMPAKPNEKPSPESRLYTAYFAAREAYSADHNGIDARSTSDADVLPYFQNPADGAAWKKYRGRPEAGK